MSGRRLALIIASSQFKDPDFKRLIAPAQDAKKLARVLGDPQIGEFEVQTIINGLRDKVGSAIEIFFQERQRDDLLLLYYSGHGIKDENGQLYFALPYTQRKLLNSSAIPATLVYDVMNKSNSQRQVLILDCCFSGAFTKGMIARDDHSIGTKERFQGHGRVILTASDNMQYAFEGDSLTGEGVQSVFTSSLINGLVTGEADSNLDGRIDLDELYDYVYLQVKEKTQSMTPGKWSDVHGEIIIARKPDEQEKVILSPPLPQLPKPISTKQEASPIKNITRQQPPLWMWMGIGCFAMVVFVILIQLISRIIQTIAPPSLNSTLSVETLTLNPGSNSVFPTITVFPSSVAFPSNIPSTTDGIPTPLLSTNTPNPPTPTNISIPFLPTVTPSFESGSVLAFQSDIDGIYTVYLWDFSNRTPQKLPLPDGYERALWPTFCNGGKIAIEVTDIDNLLPQWVYLYNFDTKNFSKWTDAKTASLYQLGVPRCSPNGKYFSYSFQSAPGGIWRFNIYDSQEGNMLSLPDIENMRNSGYPSWTTGNNNFVYMVVMNDKPDFTHFVYKTMNFPGTEFQMVTKGSNPSLSPDGKWISYGCHDAETPDDARSLCIINIGDSDVQFVIPNSLLFMMNPEQIQPYSTWSSDGLWIYFASRYDYEKGEDGDWDIYRIHPDGTDRQNLTFNLSSNEIYPALQWK